MEKLARPLLAGWFPIAVAVGAFVICFVLNVSAVWAVVAAGFLGIVTDKRTR
jgi:NhaP-type Na+/H+ or K+/H+ antiporter